MSKLKTVKLQLSDNVREVVQGMPLRTSELILSSLLDMACILVQTGDIQIEVINDRQFKLLAYARTGDRSLTVNIVSE